MELRTAPRFLDECTVIIVVSRERKEAGPRSEAHKVYDRERIIRR